MSRYFLDFLEKSSIKQKDSIQSYELQNQKVWLKKASVRHSAWVYIPLNLFSKLLGLSMLTPVPNHGGKRAIHCEIKRIHQLKKLAIQVPEILAYTDHAILLKDVSQKGKPIYQLEQALGNQNSINTRLSLYSAAIQSLQHIHDLNCYLSEAFARNILVDDQYNFTYLDFETDPKEILSLHDCQTRDWLCFIFSTAYRFDDHELQQASELLIENLAKQPKIYLDICKVAKKLQWILKLRLEKLGGDGRRLRKSILLLKLLIEHKILSIA